MTTTNYLVTTRKFWDSVPQIRVSLCKRVRTVSERLPSPPDSRSFVNKAMAIDAMKPNQILISETNYSGSTSWNYQLLIGPASTK